MEGMLNDLAISGEQSVSFEKFCRETEALGTGKIDFSVQVLTMGHWPTFKMVDVELPPVMQKCVSVFTDHFNTKTSKKRLTWAHSLGGVTVKVSSNLFMYVFYNLLTYVVIV